MMANIKLSSKNLNEILQLINIKIRNDGYYLRGKSGVLNESPNYFTNAIYFEFWRGDVEYRIADTDH